MEAQLLLVQRAAEGNVGAGRRALKLRETGRVSIVVSISLVNGMVEGRVTESEADKGM